MNSVSVNERPFEVARTTARAIDFRSGILIDRMAPHRIFAPWALFAITVILSLAWLKSRPPVAASMGVIAGPLAYWRGAQSGALAALEPPPAMIALSLGQALYTPLPAFLALRFSGIAA